LSRLAISKEEKQAGSKRLGRHKQKQISVTKKNQPANSEELQNGVAKLVLTIVKVLVDLLERQAQRKVISGTLAPDELKRLGLAFINMRQTLHNVVTQFGFQYEELNLSVASIGSREDDIDDLAGKQSLSTSALVDILDKLINKQTVIAGEIVISVADIDLVVLNLLAMLSSKIREGAEKG
jgi:methyl-accepting chemotaxis protein